jgi:UDP-N-acetylglucosamine 2-epimerase (non-hydrolysing)
MLIWSKSYTLAMEIVTVVGTRPEIIKMASVIRRIETESGISCYLVHTDQHYDESLSSSFFRVLELPEPDEHLAVGSGTHHEQTADGIQKIGSIIERREPAVALAQGDTNAVLSTAIAVSKTSSAFGHIEAGLRSSDRKMPEEINRIVADAIADFAFAPTESAMANLQDEGIKRAYLTGNTIVDACHAYRPIAESKSDILSKIGITPGEYITATVHRPLNTDNRARMEEILSSLDAMSIPVVLPAHPRTRIAIDELAFTSEKSLHIVDPLNYLEFLKLLSNAYIVVTDSGGIQEEASILEVPCLTVRPNTERPETIKAGVNQLVEPENLITKIQRLLDDPSRYKTMTGAGNLYGDGNAGERIVEIISEHY